MQSAQSPLKIAVFIDFDNVEIGVKTTLGRQFDVGAVLEAIKERGEIITKVAYGDWKRAGDHGRAMSQHAVRLVQRVMTPGGDKNGADINLALDALEMAFTHDHINAFVIVGGDSDFITLVEKLKQYDRKVFVVGGRSFTSQVMQKNCTEFLAYENITGGGDGPARPRPAGRAESGRGASASLDDAVPLVKRALKVLLDREVSPQLGLLKSTLLQLDSTFSERTYGASTFRDFAEKLEQRGFVTLKHSGRTTVVELPEGQEPETDQASAAPAAAPPPRRHHDRREPRPAEAEPTEQAAARQDSGPFEETEIPEAVLAQGVSVLRALLLGGAAAPRWPMYLRQMKQFIRTNRPDFDERKYGSLVEVLRAAQRDGLVKLERDRQGGLRVFAGAVVTRAASVPHGWTIGATAPATDDETVEGIVVEPASAVVAPVAELPPLPAAGDAAPDEIDKPKRTRRTRKLPDEAPAEAVPAAAVAAAKGRRARPASGEARKPKPEARAKREPAAAPSRRRRG